MLKILVLVQNSQSLADRRSELCRTLFTQMVNNESHSLHYLLPVKRDSQLIGRLRSATAYPTFRVRTNRFKNSFLPFCLSNYQWHLSYFILLCVYFLCLTISLCDCLYPAYGCQTTINVYIILELSWSLSTTQCALYKYSTQHKPHDPHPLTQQGKHPDYKHKDQINREGKKTSD